MMGYKIFSFYNPVVRFLQTIHAAIKVWMLPHLQKIHAVDRMVPFIIYFIAKDFITNFYGVILAKLCGRR